MTTLPASCLCGKKKKYEAHMGSMMKPQEVIQEINKVKKTGVQD
jgi:hypothetical protein